MRKETADDDSEGSCGLAVARWVALRPLVAVGGLFRIPDSVVNPNRGSDKSHPYAIVGSAVLPTDSARVGLSRFIQVSCRESFKMDQHGPMPETEDAEFQLAKARGLIFSRSDSRLDLDLTGVFTPENFTVLVQDLRTASFLGWIDRPIVESILARRGLPITLGVYPPRVR